MSYMILCEGCGARIRVLGEGCEADSLIGDASEFWPDKYACPVCSHEAIAVKEHTAPTETQHAGLIDLTPIELYAALNGMGLPKEKEATARAVVNALMRGIAHVECADVSGTSRCVITRIDTKDGCKIHLGASAHGAVVYRLVLKHDYAQKALEEGNDERSL